MLPAEQETVFHRPWRRPGPDSGRTADAGSEGMMASASGMSFNDLISPVTVRTFFDTHHHQKWLHVPDTETKSMRVFSWDGFACAR